MTSINKNEITNEQLEKAMACETAEELMAAAKEEGIELTKEEAEAYLAELSDCELDDTQLRHVAGGDCWSKVWCNGEDCTKARS
ncbi:MAG: Nif11-like leader peptide family RiPP precursor [Schwartzia sp.]|nr:Nif11-like leader peptide family RiPP precursor [Schwartzia sp. (in: firmicutes)]